MATKIQLRRDTAADWTSTNPTLAAGEFGWESDTNRFKIGDGSTAWTSLAYASDGDTAGITFVGDDSTGTLVSQNETFKIAGTQNVTTAVSGDTLTVTGPDLTSYITASSTDTLTNKTFDANGTGNSISNIETADIAAGTLVTAAEGIGSNNNDTTIPTSAAVKAYADSVGGGGASTGDITFTGSTMQSPSNADLTFETSGTGRYVFEALPSTITGNTRNDHGVVSAFTESIDASTQTTSSDRRYYNTDAVKVTLTGSGTDPDARYRGKHVRMIMDPAGYNITGTSSYGAGPQGQSVWMDVSNTTGTSTVGDVTGIQAGITITGAGTTTVTNAYGNNAWLENYETVTNNYLYQSWIDGNGSITNSYGFYYKGAIGSQTITNEYAFYDATNSLSVFGDIQTQAVSITDNLITTNRSNDNLNIETNGTGQIQIRSNGGDFATYSTSSHYNNANLMYHEDLSDTIGNGVRHYTNAIVQNIKLTSGQSSSNSSDRWRNQGYINLDLNGSSSTATSGAYRSRGPLAFDVNTTLRNDSATAASLGNASGGNYGLSIYPNNTGNITITSSTGMGSYMEVDSSSGSDITITDHVAYESIGIDHYGTNGDLTITDNYHFRAGAHGDNATGTLSLTNNYGFYFENDSTATNTYAFYDASNSLSVFGDIQTQAVSITDNVISTNRSNDDLQISTNGTGRIDVFSTGGTFFDDTDTNWLNSFGTTSRVVNLGLAYRKTVDANTTGREYANGFHMGTTLSNGSTTNSMRPRTLVANSGLDMAGYSYTGGGLYEGPIGTNSWGFVQNTGGTASTLKSMAGSHNGAYIAQDGNNSDLTVTNAIGARGIVDQYNSGSGAMTTTDARAFSAFVTNFNGGAGSATITTAYGYYVEQLSGTNTYAFYDNANALSRFGAVILANQAGDPSTVTDSAHIYAKDVASSSEVFVRDEAGNVTQISPHNEQGEWQYWSENIKTGKKVRINMERMIRKLEEITGETFIENE